MGFKYKGGGGPTRPSKEGREQRGVKERWTEKIHPQMTRKQQSHLLGG